MKTNYLTVIFIFMFVNSTRCQSVYGTSGHTPLQSTYVSPSAGYYEAAASAKAYENMQKEMTFKSNMENANNCFYRSDYNCCIYWYRLSKKLGWTSSSFDYITGVSYYNIGKKTKSKRYLKLSAKRGNYDAVIKLHELFP